jgi:hypothetical protein
MIGGAGSVKPSDPRVRNDADNRHRWHTGRGQSEFATEYVVSLPQAFGERLIDHDDRLGSRPVGVAEVASRGEPESTATAKEIRRYLLWLRRWCVARRRRAIGDDRPVAASIDDR